MSCLLIAVQQKKTKKQKTFPMSHSACANPPSHNRPPRGSCDCCLSNTELRNGNARGFKVRERTKHKRGSLESQSIVRERYRGTFSSSHDENLRKVFVFLLRSHRGQDHLHRSLVMFLWFVIRSL